MTPRTPAETDFTVTIIGGGISGTSLLYALSNYTDVDDVALLEWHDDLAPLNTDSEHNSQTLHAGDIETNYSRAKSEHVKQAADMIVAYAESVADDDSIAHPLPKMVLGVGEAEVTQLEQRYRDLTDLFPELERLYRDDLADVEPALVEGRDPDVPLLALYSDDGYAIDYGALARSFAQQARATGTSLDVRTGSKVLGITETASGYRIATRRETFTTDYVAVMAGAYSLTFAHELGYGAEYAQLPVAGGFYFGPESLTLQGKVYTVQNEKLPFAAVHGDPDIDEDGRVRFGPTALPLASRQWTQTSVPDFLHPANVEAGILADLLDPSVVRTLWDRLSDPEVAQFMAKNVLYEFPGVGKRTFLADAKKIVPTLTTDDLDVARGKGGVRPQIIDKTSEELMLGEAKIEGENILFNMTPSPGASNCLGNARDDAETILESIGGTFDATDFEADHRRPGKRSQPQAE